MSQSSPGVERVVNSLAMMAYTELTAFERIATDAHFAPTIADKIDLAHISGQTLEHFDSLVERARTLGADVVDLLERLALVFATFHERTRPRDWYESLMKGYVFDGIVKDFYRAALNALDEESERVVTTTLDDTRQADFLGNRLLEAVSDDPTLASRLALWGRRLVAETLGRIRAVVAGFDLRIDADELTDVLASVTSQHSRRMSALGLVA